MIQQGLNIRAEHIIKVKEFARKNNVQWSDNVYENITGGIIGNVNDVVKVMEYHTILERTYKEEKRNSSFKNRLGKGLKHLINTLTP